MKELEYDKTSALLTSKNQYQGNYKRVLCVCSAGLLRSATAAFVLSNEPFNYNTRNCGTEHYALIPITEVLIYWADEIVCMSELQEEKINKLVKSINESDLCISGLPVIIKKPIINLNIPDVFSYRDPRLIELIQQNYPIKLEESLRNV